MKNIYDYTRNINIYDGKTFGKGKEPIGTLSNQGADPKAPYYDDLYIQELDTGADTFQFTTVSNSYTQDLLKIGNVVAFHYNNRVEYFTITSLEYSHYEGYKTISVYAEGIGFELLEIFMERPNIPEKDEDEEDKKYPNNIYIDENGNIIYDPHGNYEYNEDKITIDGNGNIIYNPSTNKKKNNDSLEFKNISYPTFLNVLLKGTGWEIVCQPGLESVKANISVRYDTNIYAILQDSMQAFGGVELEFVYEGISKTAEEVGGGFYNTPVYKKVKAYKNGGRGSFVGRRFEYGTNVRGITKTQQVTNEDDDTVIYVDGTEVGIEVYYDIDFALKSTEIPDIEIGDTHYVIDNDFCPPMTIKARIGKIEVSFSDLTKNKITVANNKKIRGSIIDEEEVQSSVKNLDDTISNTVTDTVIDDSILDDYFGDDYFDNYATMDYVDSAIEAAQLGGGGEGGIINGDVVSLRKIIPTGPAYGELLNYVEVDGCIRTDQICATDPNSDVIIENAYLRSFSSPGGTIYDLRVDSIEFSDNTTLTSAKGLSGGSGDCDLGEYINIIKKDNQYDDLVPNHDFGVEIHMKRPVHCAGPIIFTNEMASEIGATGGSYSMIDGLAQLYTMFVNCDCIRPQNPGSPVKIDDGVCVEYIYGPKPPSSSMLDKPYIQLGYKKQDNGSSTTWKSSGIKLNADEILVPGQLLVAGGIYGSILGNVSGSSDRSLKENIRYIDGPVKRTDDLLDKADLHDFIVNQVNLCEFNFIGDDSDRIGFIANDYEGTKVGDKIVSRKGENDTFVYDVNNLLFATIGALQEEVRMRDEKIATLEDRLAKIEEMLGINNK